MAQFDTIVVGAGFSGIRMLWELQQLGHSVQCLEAGSDVGGVWYWNRYPGARTDSDGTVYSMNFGDGLKDLWDYKERYPSQPDVKAYLASVLDRFDLRRTVRFDTRVTSAHYSEADNVWTVTANDGTTYTSRFFIPATGPLSMAKTVPYAGLASFKGDYYQTSAWPAEMPSLKGKRVALVGTGATGVQLVPQLAVLAKQLTVFQRTPNYVLPARNHNIDSAAADEIRAGYDATWRKARSSQFGLPMTPSGKTLRDMADARAVRQVLDRTWEAGGFHIQTESFDDIMFDAECNAAVSEYLREKIRAVVVDAATAEMLTPKYPFLAKRPPCGHLYYEAFNRPNLRLVDISETAIDVGEDGIVSQTGARYDVDVIVFALGFDTGTGALAHMDVRAGSGPSLGEAWEHGIETFAGVQVPGFSNMFMMCGPHVPFGNMPVILDAKATWLGALLRHMKDTASTRVDISKDVAQAYTKELGVVFDRALFAEPAKAIGSWYVGGNIPGRTTRPLFYFGGMSGWKAWLAREVEGEWAGMRFS